MNDTGLRRYAMPRPYYLIDVFGTVPFTGNPLAVVGDAQGLTTEEMQAIARWFNLSETTFLLRPTDPCADYRVRIFTPVHELPFAGHPTLGSAHAWQAMGVQTKRQNLITQECGAGLVAVRRDGDRLAFAGPPLVRSGRPTEAELAEVLKVLQIDSTKIVDAAWADNGPGWIAVLLESADAVLAIEPLRFYRGTIDVGIVGPYPRSSEVAFELRAIYYNAQGTLIEDPVTGSLNASVAEWLFATGRATGDYVAGQGAVLDRTGRIYVSRDEGNKVWVGGRTATLVEGELSF